MWQCDKRLFIETEQTADLPVCSVTRNVQNIFGGYKKAGILREYGQKV